MGSVSAHAERPFPRNMFKIRACGRLACPGSLFSSSDSNGCRGCVMGTADSVPTTATGVLLLN